MLAMVREARSQGLTVPVLLMGYYNPVRAYGEERLLKECCDAGVNGFIIVDLPPEEAVCFRDACKREGYVVTSSPGVQFDPIGLIDVGCKTVVRSSGGAVHHRLEDEDALQHRRFFHLRRLSHGRHRCFGGPR